MDGEPDDIQARFLLARTLLARDRLDEAEREVAMLVRRESSNPAFQELKAQVYLKRGRIDDAMGVYRRLALDNPAARGPLEGYLRGLDLKREQTQEVDIEQYLWALEGLYRLERDPERRERIKQAIDDMRSFEAGAGAPGPTEEGPPSDAQIAARMATLPDEARPDVLRYVYVRSEPPTGELLKVIIGRLSPRNEPLPSVRGWALRILGRFGGSGLVGLVRHSLGDPASEVRPVAVDALVQLARTGGPAEATTVLALGQAAFSTDPILAAAARAGLSELMKAPMEGEDDAAQRAAFQAWWRGPTGVSARIEALSAFAEAGDPQPEGLLTPNLRDEDAFVVLTAWRVLAKEAARLLASGRVTASRAAWLRTLPPIPSGTTAASVAQARPALSTWAAARPN